MVFQEPISQEPGTGRDFAYQLLRGDADGSPTRHLSHPIQTRAFDIQTIPIARIVRFKSHDSVEPGRRKGKCQETHQNMPNEV
jgi:hypothetical protein